MATDDNPHHIATIKSDFVKEGASKSLRICCYGSSSAKTPTKYLDEAWSCGYILARRGHVCVNGAGSCGCMGALNDGASDGNGKIVGVIHEMFIVDGSDWLQKHENGGGPHPELNESERGGHRELLVAGGDDLQERKKLLVTDADAIIVLPGGPGTWDELWEMVCARNIGMSAIPIVAVSVDGYYKPFKDMLDRSFQDYLIKMAPGDLVHFVSTSEEAIRWVEAQTDKPVMKKPHLQRRKALVRHGFINYVASIYRSFGFKPEQSLPPSFFVAGLALGVAFGATVVSKRK